jgi:hypothetical protein
MSDTKAATGQPTPQAALQEQETATAAESFAEFKNSFFYAGRTDLLFKFMKNLPDAEAAEFLHGLLARLGETVDDGDLRRILDYVYTWNVRGYAHEDGPKNPWSYDEGPFSPLGKPLSEAKLGLLTTTGNFVEGDDPAPFGMQGLTQEDTFNYIKEFAKAEPQLSRIPLDTPPERIVTRHPGYDIRAMVADRNVALPFDRLREAQTAGRIGSLLPEAYSFVGLTAQRPLLSKHAPEWAAMLQAQQVDAVLLVPV